MSKTLTALIVCIVLMLSAGCTTSWSPNDQIEERTLVKIDNSPYWEGCCGTAHFSDGSEIGRGISCDANMVWLYDSIGNRSLFRLNFHENCPVKGVEDLMIRDPSVVIVPEVPKDARYGCPGCPSSFADFADDMCGKDGVSAVTDGENTRQCIPASQKAVF